MAKRDSFLLRIDPKILAGLRRWADDEMRSVNGQIEFLLRKTLRDAGRLSAVADDDPAQTDPAQTDPAQTDPAQTDCSQTEKSSDPKNSDKP